MSSQEQLSSSQALPSTESMELEIPLDNPQDNNALSSAFATAPMPIDQLLPAAETFEKQDEPMLGMQRSSSLFLNTNIQRCAVEVLSWGRADCGQLGLGDGSLIDTPVPQPIEALRGKDITCVAAGLFHTVALTSDGELYSFGANDEGQCAKKGVDQLAVPSRIEALENFRVGMAACGASHTLAVTEDGMVLAFGAADFGQLGIGPVSGSKQIHPKICKGIKESRIARAAAGGNHSLFLEASGMVHVTGDASFGALGTNTAHTSSLYSPLQLSRLWPVGITQIAAGDAHSVALSADGEVYSWGRGRAGALGLGDFLGVGEPTRIKSLAGTRIKQITCGADHTIAVGAAGEVFSWGQGKFGALGLGHVDTVCSPQKIVRLEGEEVLQASAGGRHTLFLTADSAVWATGCNDNGQCGVEEGRSSGIASSTIATDGSTSIVMTPRKVAGIVPPNGSKVVLFVVAGGDHSIAVVQEAVQGEHVPVGPVPGRKHGERWLPASPAPLLPAVRAAAQSALDSGSAESAAANPAIRALKECIERTFSNPSYLVNAFLTEDSSLTSAAAQEGNRPTETRLGVPKLDLSAISEAYNGILQLYNHGVVSILGTASIKLLEMTEKYLKENYLPTPGSKHGPNLDVPLISELSWVPPALFIILQNPLASDPSTYGSQIILRLGRIISATLPAEQRIPVRRAMQSLLGQLPADTFAARCVRPVQRYLTHLVTSGRLGAGRLEAMMAGVLLDVLRQANEDSGTKIPYHEFYNKALSDSADLQAEYLAWVKHKESSPNALVSFCQMPFLLTPEAKSNILHGESMMQKQQHMSAAAMQAFFRGQNPSEAGFLRLSIRRSHVVEDALNGLSAHLEDLKKPLKVTFISAGDVPEPAQDEGGVRKEFFQLLTRDLFKSEFGMFTYDENTRTHWLNPASLENEYEFSVVGALIGLAIYNAVLLDVHFPLVLYKKLLGGAPNFSDLKAAFPELGRGLQALLDYEPAEDVESVFCRNFEVEYEFYGEMLKKELKPGGAENSVDGENRREYVKLYTEWVLNESISKQFSAFAQGFLSVCGGPALSTFTPQELELLVCGLPHLDFEGLQRAAKYEGGFTRDNLAVKWFWEIVRGMTLEQKRQFLSFTTGSDRAPVGGLSQLSICIQRAGPDTDRLPTSHTCFNILLLPEYVSKGKMAERLTTAIMNAQGFGLQ